MTVHEAWAVAYPEVESLDPSARLSLVTSGLNLDHTGRSLCWEFVFVLPALRARALVTLSPAEDAEDVDAAPIELARRLTAAPESELTRAALPLTFRDSPEVVAELAAQGVDFVAGPTDMKLESRVLASGEPVWVTWYWGDERRVAFAKRPT